MIDYQKIKAVCDNNTRISKSLVDEFLLYFIAQKEGLEGIIIRQLNNYQKIIAKMPKEWAGMLMSQLIAHRIFKKNGLAGEYLNHAWVQMRKPEDLEYLRFQIEHPWRFSYCSIQSNVAENIYEMKDVLSDEIFLLYSPGLANTIRDFGSAPHLWFLLIGFNGECYQTYGTLEYFKGIQPFDLLFFAKQLNSKIPSFNEVPDLIESNPMPFLLVWSGAELPVTFHKKDLVVFNKSELYIKDFSLEKYEEDFIIEKNHPIYMLSLKRWHSFPHFAKCFYHATKNQLLITSMTKRGYDALISALNKRENNFSINPEILVTPAMLFVVKDVLHIDVEINPYEKHFQKETLPQNQKELDKINLFLKNLISKLNNKLDYDISEMASDAGIGILVAEQIAESLIKKISNNPGKK